MIRTHYKRFAFSASLLVSMAHAAEYYVATTGDDSNAGTLAEPFSSIQKAADTVAPATRFMKNKAA